MMCLNINNKEVDNYLQGIGFTIQSFRWFIKKKGKINYFKGSNAKKLNDVKIFKEKRK
jgi:hypothetical protein